MKKWINYTLLLILSLGVISCNKKLSQRDRIIAEENDAIQASLDSFSQAKDRWRWPDSIKSVFEWPAYFRYSAVPKGYADLKIVEDCLPQEKEIGIAVSRIYLKNMKLKGTTIVLNLSREEFMKTGIPEVYYDEMLENAKFLNFLNKIYKVSNNDIVFDWYARQGELRKKLEEYSAKKRFYIIP